jgi:hypothetical protein
VRATATRHERGREKLIRFRRGRAAAVKSQGQGV